MAFVQDKRVATLPPCKVAAPLVPLALVKSLQEVLEFVPPTQNRWSMSRWTPLAVVSETRVIGVEDNNVVRVVASELFCRSNTSLDEYVLKVVRLVSCTRAIMGLPTNKLPFAAFALLAQNESGDAWEVKFCPMVAGSLKKTWMASGGAGDGFGDVGTFAAQSKFCAALQLDMPEKIPANNLPKEIEELPFPPLKSPHVTPALRPVLSPIAVPVQKGTEESRVTFSGPRIDTGEIRWNKSDEFAARKLSSKSKIGFPLAKIVCKFCRFAVNATATTFEAFWSLLNGLPAASFLQKSSGSKSGGARFGTTWPVVTNTYAF